MISLQQAYVAKKLPYEPFIIEHLPLISKLQRIGFHTYKNRWAKRLGKKLGRAIFDIAYQSLKLSGQIEVSITNQKPKETCKFDARQQHYAKLFNNKPVNVCEPELATLLESFLTEDKVFYDIGANWGYFSMYAAALPEYQGKIYTFEPVESTYSELQKWVNQSGQEDRITCQKFALSNRDGTAQMGIVADDSGLASLDLAGNTDIEIHDVQTKCLDSLSYPKPDFVKLDVEGYEFEVLEGGENTLKSHKPMLMFENWIVKDDAESTLRPIKILQEYGYKLFVPMWLIAAPTNDFYWPGPHQPFPEGEKKMAYVPFDIGTRFSLRDQINFFCCHEDRLDELEQLFDVQNMQP